MPYTVTPDDLDIARIFGPGYDDEGKEEPPLVAAGPVTIVEEMITLIIKQEFEHLPKDVCLEDNCKCGRKAVLDLIIKYVSAVKRVASCRARMCAYARLIIQQPIYYKCERVLLSRKEEALLDQQCPCGGVPKRASRARRRRREKNGRGRAKVAHITRTVYDLLPSTDAGEEGEVDPSSSPHSASPSDGDSEIAGPSRGRGSCYGEGRELMVSPEVVEIMDDDDEEDDTTDPPDPDDTMDEDSFLEPPEGEEEEIEIVFEEGPPQIGGSHGGPKKEFGGRDGCAEARGLLQGEGSQNVPNAPNIQNESAGPAASSRAREGGDNVWSVAPNGANPPTCRSSYKPAPACVKRKMAEEERKKEALVAISPLVGVPSSRGSGGAAGGAQSAAGAASNQIANGGTMEDSDSELECLTDTFVKANEGIENVLACRPDEEGGMRRDSTPMEMAPGPCPPREEGSEDSAMEILQEAPDPSLPSLAGLPTDEGQSAAGEASKAAAPPPKSSNSGRVRRRRRGRQQSKRRGAKKKQKPGPKAAGSSKGAAASASSPASARTGPPGTPPPAPYDVSVHLEVVAPPPPGEGRPPFPGPSTQVSEEDPLIRNSVGSEVPPRPPRYRLRRSRKD